MLTLVTLHGGLKVDALVLVSTVALHMSRSRLAHGPAVLTLRHGPTLSVDVLQPAVCKSNRSASSVREKTMLLTRVLAVGHSVAAHTSLAGPLLSVDNHNDLMSRRWAKKW